jgi:trehalose 6-phosphate phosphatase
MERTDLPIASGTPLDWLGTTRPPALFLDLDGTLIDVAATPESVVVPRGLVDLLVDLRDTLDGALAIVTGRSIADIDRLLAPACFVAAGQHGAEYRTDVCETVRCVAPALPLELIARLQDLAADVPGSRLEDKGVSVSLHWRAVPEAAGHLAVATEAIVADFGRDFVIRPGRRVFEVGSAHVSKGVAVELLAGLARFDGRLPIAIGDDHADALAIAAAERLDGVGFRVAGETWGPDEADFASPRAVREWLSLLLERMQR